MVTVEDGVLVWVERGKKEGVALACTKAVGKMEEHLLVFTYTVDVGLPDLVCAQKSWSFKNLLIQFPCK